MTKRGTASGEDDTRDLLRGVDIFAGLTDEELDGIAQRSSRLKVAKGETVISAGGEADTLFVILRGKLSVWIDGRQIAELQQGETAGDLAFFAEGARTADVMAERDARLLVLTRAQFDDMATALPQITRHILASMARRMSVLTTRSKTVLPRAGRIIAIMPLPGGYLTQGFKAQLETAVADHKTLRLLKSADAGEGKNAEALAAWLHEQEAEGDRLVILACTGDSDDWRDMAMAHSDSWIGFVDGQKLPETATATALPDQLIVYRDRAADPVPHYISPFAEDAPNLHHQVAGDDPASFERLLRYATDRALGVVMAGGGALATAHLGAVAALQDNGYRFDMYGGTSAGAGAAAGFALGLEPREIIQRCQRIFVESGVMNRFNVPIHSLLDHRAYDEQLKENYGSTPIRDLPTHFFALSTSLSSNDAHVHRTGPLWSAVRASTSIPAVFSPYLTDDGEVLIDGALIDNIPLATMRDLKAGPNLVLNFQAGSDWRVKADYDAMPGRRLTLWRLISAPFRFGKRQKRATRFPTIAQVLLRTMVVTARRAQSEMEMELGDDVIITIPALRGMGFLEWKKGTRQFELAYNSLDEALKAVADTGGSDIERLRRASRYLEKRSAAS